MTPLPTVELDPPTISMTFGVNDSPLAGRDGTHVSIFQEKFYVSLIYKLFNPIKFSRVMEAIVSWDFLSSEK